MAEGPTISIGLPVYNGERFLETSARALLEQTFEDFELVICDNASTDTTPDICRRLAAEDERVRIVRHRHNVGAAENFNSAVHHSGGAFFKWAADDDLHHPQFLERCLLALEQNDAAVLAYTRAESITADGSVIRPNWGDHPDLGDESPSIRFDAALAPPRDPIPLQMFAVVRRDVLTRTGLVRPMPDFDRALVAELSLHGPFIEISEVLFGHREHEGRMGPVLASDSRGAAAVLGQQGLLPHWRLLRRHLASVGRRPAAVEARPLLTALARWSWRWRNELAGDLGAAALRPAAHVPGLGDVVERGRSRRRMARWTTRQDAMEGIVRDVLDDGDRLVLIDDDAVMPRTLDQWSTRRLLSPDSPDGSFPATGAEAIERLDVLVSAGYTHVAIAWPAFWILDYYHDVARHLDECHHLVARSDDVVVYRLSAQGTGA